MIFWMATVHPSPSRGVSAVEQLRRPGTLGWVIRRRPTGGHDGGEIADPLGCMMAIVCTITPPTEAPTTCAGSSPSASSSSTASSAMSSSL
jgi:hypothetical protein